MNQIKDNLTTSLISQVKASFNVDLSPEEIELSKPADTSHGDFASNLPLKLFGQITALSEVKNPRDLAQKLVDGLTGNPELSVYIAKIEVAGPGFINFYLSEAFLMGQIQEILGSKGTFSFDLLKDQNVMVEYTDPNPFKVFHIGHLFSNIVGESLARLHERAGANVFRVCYQGDVGMHVAKSIWGLIQKLEEDGLEIEALADKDLNSRIVYLGQGYAIGAQAFIDKPEAQIEMKQINLLAFKAAQSRLKEESPEEVHLNYDKFLEEFGDIQFNYDQIKKIYLLGRAWSLEYFEQVYRRLAKKSKFDLSPDKNYFRNYFFESLTAEYGYPLVTSGLEDKIFEESQGAVIFPGDKYGLHNRVFINSLGLPTYEAKDLGLMMKKEDWFSNKYNKQLDKSIIVTANEISEYFKVVFEAARQINPDIPAKTFHVSHGLVKLPEGKMSSRTGNIIGGVEMLDMVKESALEVIQTAAQDKDKKEVNDPVELAEKVAKSAVKYAFLKSNTNKDVIFNKEEALSFQGNSGPYIQYTYVRCLSVLGKLGLSLDDDVLNSITKQFDALVNNKVGVVEKNERDILRYIYQYIDQLRLATTELSPHLIANFVFELSQLYNTYYGQTKIVGSGPDKEPLRVAITAAVALVLADGLDVLGIEVVERM